MKTEDITLLYIHKWSRALCCGTSTPLVVRDLSGVAGISLEQLMDIRFGAIHQLISHLRSETVFLLGLGLAHAALLDCSPVLAERAVVLLISAAVENQNLDGPWMHDIVERLHLVSRQAS